MMPHNDVTLSHRGEDGEDDLDAFMSGINAQANADRQSSLRKEEMIQTDEKVPVDDETGDKGRRDDIEEEDAQESYFNFLEDYKVRHENDDEDVYEYDEDGNIVWTWKKVIDPLPSIDHSAMAYKPFNRDLYKLEHEDIAKLSPREVFELRNRLDIRVYGSDVPRPVVSFAHLPFDEKLMRQIRNSEYERPTPIQSQAIPAALKGRDVLGLAKTGSGMLLL
jgi:ATP-dependent RNA helicase DDX42